MATTTSKKSTRKPKAERSADRADKSVEAFRDALERSITLPRERIQEVVDDAVKRGRMTRDDANDMVSKLAPADASSRRRWSRSWRPSSSRRANRSAQHNREAQQADEGRRPRAEVAKRTRDAADEPLAQIDKVKDHRKARCPVQLAPAPLAGGGPRFAPAWSAVRCTRTAIRMTAAR